MSRLVRVIESGWQVHGLTAIVLLPLALLFGLMTALRRQLFSLGIFRSTTLPVPVIVVGNITVGGSGKTPLTIALVKALQDAGFQPGVVSRGYGGTHSRDDLPAAQANSVQAKIFGDEAVLMAAQTLVPVYVGRQRALAAKALLSQHPATNVILCDDGLQHYALRRDVEIAVFDERSIGNGWLLPAGPLREPVSRLAKVQAVVLNGDVQLTLADNLPVFQMRLLGQTAYRLQHPEQSQTLRAFAGQKLLAAAGIGNPQRFFNLLHDAGLAFAEMPLPDHYDFHDNPFSDVPADAILITEKDAVKCDALHDPRLWVVPVQAEIDPGLLQLIMQFITQPLQN